MLEALRTLATISDYNLPQLEHIAEELGPDHKVRRLSVPVSVLIRAKRAYAHLDEPREAFTSMSTVVALAEAYVNNQSKLTLLALQRGVDNLRKARV